MLTQYYLKLLLYQGDPRKKLFILSKERERKKERF